MTPDIINIFNKLSRKAIAGLEPYNPGASGDEVRIKLSANENNFSTPPKVIEAMAQALRCANRYPDITCAVLRERLTSFYGIPAVRFLIGNGSDGIFTMLGRAFIEERDEVLCPELTFSVYKDIVIASGARPVLVPMTTDFGIDVAGIIGAVTPRAKLIFLCNPNNPTGTLLSKKDIETLLCEIPSDVLIVLDEAYIEFAGNCVSGFDYVLKYPNLIVCRTFSKIYALAGMRVGYMCAHEALLKHIYKVREPYCVSAVAAAGAAAALDETQFIKNTQDAVSASKKVLCKFLDAIGLEYVPSHANFVFVKAKEKAVAIRDALLKDGIEVRLLSHAGEKHYLRISIGTEEENAQLMRSLEKIFKN